MAACVGGVRSTRCGLLGVDAGGHQLCARSPLQRAGNCSRRLKPAGWSIGLLRPDIGVTSVFDARGSMRVHLSACGVALLPCHADQHPDGRAT
jgi:hypothetical protein